MKIEQSSPKLWWTILRFAPFALLQLAYVVVSYYLFELIDSCYGSSDLLGSMFIASSIICEIAFCLTVAGIVGRHWLIGFSLGSALITLQGFLFIHGGPSFAPYREEWAICGVPAVFLLACTPLFCMRRFLGWRLTAEAETTKSRTSIEDLLLTTLVVACSLVCFRMPYSAWRAEYAFFDLEDQVSELVHWTTGAATSLFAAITVLFIVLPTLWIWLSRKTVLWKCVVQLVFLAVSTGFATAILILIKLTTEGTAGPLDEALYYGAVVSIAALPTYLAKMYALCFAGLTMPRAESARKPAAELQPEKGPSTEASPFSEATSQEQETTLRLATVPRCLAAAILLATIAGAVTLQDYVQRLEQRNALFKELVKFAESNGGSFETYDSNVFQLTLWQGSTDQDLLRFKSLALTTLDLADANVSAEAISKLERLESLYSVELGRPTDIGAALTNLCSRAQRLSDITVYDSQLNVSDLQAMRSLTGEEIQISFVRCSFKPNSTNGFTGFPHGLTTLEAVDCGLTDDLVGNWLTDSVYHVDLSKNALKGEIDLEPLQGERSPLSPYWQPPIAGYAWRHIDLSGNPLDDDVFGQSVVGMKLHSLALNETTLTDRFFEYLKQAKSAYALELNSEGFTEEALAKADPHGLTRLSLEGRQFTGHCFRDWHPASLESLSLAGSSADDETVKYLESLSLQSLDISNAKISAKALLESDLAAGLEIKLDESQYTASEIARLKKKFPNINSLVL